MCLLPTILGLVAIARKFGLETWSQFRDLSRLIFGGFISATAVKISVSNIFRGVEYNLSHYIYVPKTDIRR
jgi:hypothetical protein